MLFLPWWRIKIIIMCATQNDRWRLDVTLYMNDDHDDDNSNSSNSHFSFFHCLFSSYFFDNTAYNLHTRRAISIAKNKVVFEKQNISRSGLITCSGVTRGGAKGRRWHHKKGDTQMKVYFFAAELTTTLDKPSARKRRGCVWWRCRTSYND